MLTLPPAVRVYIALDPIYCRKSFDGLSAAVGSLLGEDPTSGHLFVFFNRRGNQCRILFWDRSSEKVSLAQLTLLFDELLPPQWNEARPQGQPGW